MSDIENYAVWGLLAGGIAGVALHWRVRDSLRPKVVGVLLAFGFMTVLLVGLVATTGMTGKIERAAWNYAIIGFPMAAAGIAMVALDRIWKLAPIPKKAVPRVRKPREGKPRTRVEAHRVEARRLEAGEGPGMTEE